MPKGLHRSNYTQGRDKAAHTARKPEAEWVWNEVEPIISEELWATCNGLLEGRARGKRPAKRTTYLFSGLAVCDCGAKMYVPAKGLKYVCMKCRRKIPLADLEAIYVSTLADFECSAEEVAAHRQAADEALREKSALVDAAEAELKRLATSENELFELYHAGAVTKGDFARRHRPTSERRAQLEDELPRLQADRDVLKIGLVSEEVLMDDNRDLRGRWASMSHEQRRQMVEQITSRLVVRKEGVDVEILQSPFGNGDQMATNARLFLSAGPSGERGLQLGGSKNLGPRLRGDERGVIQGWVIPGLIGQPPRSSAAGSRRM